MSIKCSGFEFQDLVYGTESEAVGRIFYFCRVLATVTCWVGIWIQNTLLNNYGEILKMILKDQFVLLVISFAGRGQHNRGTTEPTCS